MISVKRTRLLAAGAAVAERVRLDQLTADGIAAEARLDNAHFAAEFDSMETYLVELQRDFLEGILQAVVAAVGAVAPGLDRMTQAMNVQLDLCLERRGLRRLLVEARRRIPQVADTFHKQSQVTALMMGIELKALGCTNPAVIGRMYWMLMLEAAQLEGEQGSEVPVARKALRDFVGSALATESA